MELLQEIFSVLIWFLCLPLVALILLQGGAGDLSSTFGGGGQLDSTLGVGASRKMGKITGTLALAFMVCVLVLAVPNEGAIAASGAGDDEDSAEAQTPIDALPSTIDPAAELEPADAEATPEAADAENASEPNTDAPAGDGDDAEQADEPAAATDADAGADDAEAPRSSVEIIEEDE